MKKKDIEIIIPCKDELKNLKIIVPFIKKLYNYNILIIDKSKDTIEIKNFCNIYKHVNYHYQKSNGKGNALREAANLSRAKILVFFDADCSHDPKDIKNLLNPMLKHKSIDHVGGSRMKGGSDELFSDVQHFLRLFGSLFINYIINLKFKTNLTDSQNGLRAIKKKVFIYCRTKSIHTSIEMELVSRTLANGFNYIEIPTHEWTRLYGKSKINLLAHSWSYIYQLIKICFFKIKRKKSKIKYREETWFKK